MEINFYKKCEYFNLMQKVCSTYIDIYEDQNDIRCESMWEVLV